LNSGLRTLPPGHVGAVVTYLEMREPPVMPGIPPSPLRLDRWDEVDPDAYRSLFRKVGGRWLWYSRLAMDDPTLLANVAEVHTIIAAGGEQVGMLELDFRQPGDCLIRFLGLVPELAGQGHGRWLFAQTLALAWRSGIGRVRVNTCTLDHPAALPSYLKAGFTAYARSFENFPDPRLAGLLPRGIAPQIPLLD